VLTQVVDNFIDEIGRDAQIMTFFKDTDVERFRSKMIEHLCQISDGPCTYSGDSMVEVHTNMGVTETAFNRTVDLLVNAMTRAGVSHPLQNRVLQRLAPLRSEIIYITR
jgi:hemoglobin